MIPPKRAKGPPPPSYSFGWVKHFCAVVLVVVLAEDVGLRLGRQPLGRTCRCWAETTASSVVPEQECDIPTRAAPPRAVGTWCRLALLPRKGGHAPFPLLCPGLLPAPLHLARPGRLSTGRDQHPTTHADSTGGSGVGAVTYLNVAFAIPGKRDLGGCGAFRTITAHSSPNENVC